MVQLCQGLLDLTKAEMGPINIYQVYADVCIPKRVAAEGKQLMDALAGRPPLVTASIALTGVRSF